MKKEDINYDSLAQQYNDLFPQYRFNGKYLESLHKNKLNVLDKEFMIEFLSNDTRERAKRLNEAYGSKFKYVEELAQQIQIEEALRGGEEINDELFQKRFGRSQKATDSLGSAEALNPDKYYQRVPVNTSTPWTDRFRSGFRAGNDFGARNNIEANLDNHHPGYARSVFERAPEVYWEGRDPVGRAGFMGGKVAASLTGMGDRKYVWNIHPADIAWTGTSQYLKGLGASRGYAHLGGFLSQEALGLVSGNINPLNFSEGGRPAGYEAISANSDDPTKSNAPLLDFVVHRGLLGRTGKLLPWEQFTQERPDVSHESYSNYRDWLWGKEKDPLSKATLGLAKFYHDDEIGTEARILGYRTTPLGIAAAASIPFVFGTEKMRQIVDPILKTR